MADQVPHETKIERMERLVELTQRIARERNEARVGRVEEVLVEGPVAHRRDAAARPHAPQHDRQLRRRRAAPASSSRSRSSPRPRRRCAAARQSWPQRRVSRCASSSPARRARSARTSPCGCSRTATGSSASTSASNTWTREFDTLLQDLAIQYPAFKGGIAGVEYPEVDLVVHMAAHAKVHQLVRQPHRALENAIMTFNVLEYCRQLELPLVFSSTREVYGDVHRFEEYGEAAADFAYTESPYSASKIASEAFIYCYARCYGLKYLVFRFSNVYGRYDSDLQRMERVLPKFIHQMSRGEPITVYGGEEKVLDFTYIDDCVDGIARGIERLADGRVDERDDQPRLRPGQHARARRRADRRRARRRAADQPGAVARRRGHALRRRHPQGARPARVGAADAARRGHPARGALVPRVARGASRGGPPARRGRAADGIEHGFKQPAGAGA